MDLKTYNATMLGAAKAHASYLGVTDDTHWQASLSLIQAAFDANLKINWTAVMKLVADIAAKAPISTILADIVAVFSS